MKKRWKLAIFAAALTLLLALGAGAAQEEGVSVQVRDGYSCAYGISVPFTRSPRTREYTFTIYPGEAAAGEPEVTADVTIKPAGTTTVYLPLRYDPVAPGSWTLTITAHVEEQRTGLDREASFTETFTTRPTCGCAAGTKGAFYAGDGSEGSPFRVATPDQLNHVRVHNERCYRQIADLDFAGWGDFMPIWPNASLSANHAVAYGGFIGTYDGGGHILKNLRVVSAPLGPVYSLPDYDGYTTSLFVGRDMRLYNLGMDASCTVTSKEVYIGSLVSSPGMMDSVVEIERCYSAAALTVPEGFTNYAGGVVGLVTGRALMKDCFFAGSLYSPKRCSGLMDQVRDDTSSMSSSYNIGSIVGSTVKRDGLWSYAYDHTVPTAASFSVSTWPTVHGTNLEPSGFSALGTFSAWDFDSVWRMGEVTRRTSAGGTETVQAPVLRVFDDPLDS